MTEPKPGMPNVNLRRNNAKYRGGSGCCYATASRARLRISICMLATGIQNNPATA
jgi:hypothetical protein